nr:hypothetical protein BdHM001_34900 [Bdellovibrio sp. HM001]
MSQKIITLVGLAKSGKSTALEVIKRLCEAQEVQLAKHLKDVTSMVLNIHRPDMDDQRYKELQFGHLPYDANLVEFLGRRFYQKTGLTWFYERGNRTMKPVVLNLVDLMTVIDLFDIPVTNDNVDKLEKFVGKVIRTPREGAQFLGTDVLREFDPDIHVNFAKKKMDPSKVAVVSDSRFHNELDAFAGPNTLSLFILRNAVIPPDLSKAHPSERGVLEVGERCQFKIENNGSLKDFEERITALVTQFLNSDKD